MTQQIVLQETNGKPLIEAPQPNGAAALMRVIERAALDPTFDVAKLQALLDVKERWEKDEARKAFEDAMAAFKQEVFVITKDKENKQYKSWYTSLGNAVNTVSPYLGKHGLSTTWDIDQAGNVITVTCVLTHRLGHSKRCSMTVPPDKSGAKNPIQEIKSAITYAKGCTFDSVCGTASTDANLDDDGNAASSQMDQDELSERIKHFAKCQTLSEVFEHYKKSFIAAEEMGDTKAQVALAEAKDNRKKEIQDARAKS